MSAQKGSNGIEDGKRNVRLFLAWKAGVDDFKPYIHQGELNKSRIARELGFGRNAFRDNDDLRDIHWPQLLHELEDKGILKQRAANPVEDIPRQRGRNVVAEARMKQLQEENAALKAERDELKKAAVRNGFLNEILETTGRLPW